MEKVEDIVIVGGGIAGLTASLGLHKYPSSLSFYMHVNFFKLRFDFFFFKIFIQLMYNFYSPFFSLSTTVLLLIFFFHFKQRS